MKTQIIHIEPHDDINSLLDKVTWSQSDQIILVWPIHNSPIQSQLDITRIARHAQSEATPIAFVSRSTDIQQFAEKFHIPVFRTIRNAQSTPWQDATYKPPLIKQDPEQRQQRIDTLKQKRSLAGQSNQLTPAARTTAFTIGFIAFLTLVIAILPSAEITLSPKTQSQSIIIDAAGSTSLSTYNLAGDLPARIITLPVEGRKSIPTSGTLDIPDQFANGTIILTNLTNQAITVPIGTIVRTLGENPIRFRTTQVAELDPTAGSTAEISIQAVDPGTSANLPSASILLVEGEHATNLSVTNPEPTTGGTAITSPAPTQEDYNTLQAQLLDDLWLNALSEAISNNGDNNLILDQLPLTTTILIEEYTPAQAQLADQLSLHLQVEFEMRIITQQDLFAMGNDILNAALPVGSEAFPSTLVINHLTRPELNPETGTYKWQIEFSRNMFQKPNPGALAQSLLGKSPQTAQNLLTNNLDLENEPVIHLSPSWWPFLPILPLRITFLSQ